MKRTRLFSFLLLGILLAPLGLSAQNTETDRLPRSTPETQGVASQGIAQFLDAVDASRHEFHSLVLIRHGHVIAEGWWAPYRPDLKHMMYSVSKSFTSTAVGFAVSENRLSVDDQVVSFFPDLTPPANNPLLSDLTIRNLLSMAAGQDPDPSGKLWSTADWEQGFFQTPILKKPGSTFLYNSMATYMLSAIVTKVTGQQVIDYLKPRLFSPLGITDIDWETSPSGPNTGGWGLRIRTVDMAKFGLLLLQQGAWNGQQILSSDWVNEATKRQILQSPDAPQEQRDQSDWLQGYGYKFWRCRKGGFRADGAFGQYIIVLPEQDAVIAITSLTNDMQAILNLVWEHLLPAMEADELPENEASSTTLNHRLQHLALPIPATTQTPTIQQAVSGKTFAMDPNEIGLESVSFQFADDQCVATLQHENARYTIPTGSGKWVHSHTGRPGPSLTAAAQNNFQGLPAFEVAAAYQWKEDNTLELTIRYLESPHTESITAVFDANQIRLNSTSPQLGQKPGMPIVGHAPLTADR